MIIRPEIIKKVYSMNVGSISEIWVKAGNWTIQLSNTWL